jgi:hypothetical protein
VGFASGDIHIPTDPSHMKQVAMFKGKGRKMFEHNFSPKLLMVLTAKSDYQLVQPNGCVFLKDVWDFSELHCGSLWKNKWSCDS